jgi:DNA-binding GntR family transcriptional regulator
MRRTLPAHSANRDRSSSGPGDADFQARSRKVQRTQGFVEEVFAIIRADIMSLRILPDARISIDRLARELGVSQTPIREALSMLEAIGLVTRRHHAGYWSAPQLTREQIDDLFELRLLLEPYAAGAAARRISDSELALLVGHVEAMDAAKHVLPYDQYADRDAELHDMIAAGSGNPIIRQTLNRLHSHLHIFRLRSSSHVTSEANLEHNAIMEAMCLRDSEQAQNAMRAHIQLSYDRLVKPEE